MLAVPTILLVVALCKLSYKSRLSNEVEIGISQRRYRWAACTVGLCRVVVVEPAGAVTFTSPEVQHWGAGALGLTFIANIWGVLLVALRFRYATIEILSLS